MTNRNSEDGAERYRYQVENSTTTDESDAANRRMTAQEIIDAHNQQTYRRQIKSAISIFIGMSVFALFIAAPLAYLILKSADPGLGFLDSLFKSLPTVIAVSLLLGLVFAASAIMRRPPSTSDNTARSVGSFFRIGIFRR